MTSSFLTISRDEREAAYQYLGKQTPNTVADLMIQWTAPLRRGCTKKVSAECNDIKALIWMWLYYNAPYTFAKSVLRELCARGEEEILEERDWWTKELLMEPD